ncbi:hypothetical protein HEQ75_23040 [Roseomonas sp. BU-1]|uniref:Uncharacterized protein n=2 Tax=Falsiroseomonas selenitidurans TaxID=2716335 RepID=A0ABX1EDC2_9PROT|nr:hypothetical protein [Falsiroseomonas selenitidurans]
MGVLIVLGTVGLVVVLVQRMGGAAGEAALPPASLGQPAGTRMLSVAAAEGRIAVLVARPDGTERLLLLEPRRGRVVGELRAAE